MKVPFVDLGRQHRRLSGELRWAIDGVIERGDFVLGEELERFEQEFAAFCGARHAVGVDSGVSALELALRALGVGPGDEVVTVANTFIATVSAIAFTGARPTLVDIQPDTLQMDVTQLERAITPRTRAIIPVHLYGCPADVEAVAKVAAAYNLAVIEDACQAHGARVGGRRVGSLGTAAAFSFYPSKNLGAFGDGGMCVTNSAELAHRMKILRVHGAEPEDIHKVVGGNFRLDALQAAILRVKLRHLDDWSAARRRNADLYERKIRALGLPESVLSTPAARESRHVFNQYVLRTPDRDGAVAALAGRGIGTEIYYPLPLHLQPCFANLGHGPGSFPAAERAARETFAVPIYPELTEAEIDLVVGALAAHFETKAHVA